MLGDALGRLYVEKHFPPAARCASSGCSRTCSRRRDALREAEWMSPQARREALDKLAAISTGVGYPERWHDYSGLTIRPDDLLGNWQRALKFESQSRLGNVAGSAGGEWVLPPQTVNAYYSPSANEMVIPAAILQPPLFDTGADDAVNYGAAGALIGHELSHAFDDRGRRFDGAGAVRDWWTEADARAYEQRRTRLMAQMNAYEPLPGLRVNAALTSPESMGDLSGLTIAFRAYQASLNGKRSAVIDGLTGDQRFFMGWAQIWRAKERDEYLRSTLQTSAYLPAALRANAAASNVDGFFAAFGVKPGNRLYRAPVERVGSGDLMWQDLRYGFGRFATSRLHGARRPDPGARHRRRDDDLQRHPERPARSLPMREANRVAPSDPRRHDPQPFGRGRCRRPNSWTTSSRTTSSRRSSAACPRTC